jgi:hypothetical protein
LADRPDALVPVARRAPSTKTCFGELGGAYGVLHVPPPASVQLTVDRSRVPTTTTPGPDVVNVIGAPDPPDAATVICSG